MSERSDKWADSLGAAWELDSIEEYENEYFKKTGREKVWHEYDDRPLWGDEDE